MAKETPTHLDKLKREIKLGDYVAYPQSNSLCIGSVIKLNNKMVKVSNVNHKTWKANKYPSDVVVLDPDQVVFYLLAGGK